MSKPPKNKLAKNKKAKSGGYKPVPIDEEIRMKHSLMKYAEEMFEFDEKGDVVKRKFDTKGIHILNVDEDDDDEIVDPKMLLPKEDKKIKVNKGKKKIVNTSNQIDAADLLNNLINPNKKSKS